MLLVLVMMNLMFLGASVFGRAVHSLGRGLEMTVYLKSDADHAAVDRVGELARGSGDFERVEYVGAAEATRRFLTGLGPDSAALMNDPKWTSPIPGTFELRLSDAVQPERRGSVLREWSAKFRAVEIVEDVFYGQGWVEQFSRFVSGSRVVFALLWLLGSCVGLLIVGNCIRLSFLQRRDEIEVLELVGATALFIRRPYLVEGFLIGLVASVGSLGLSWGLHSGLLGWLARAGEPWVSMAAVAPLPWWAFLVNVVSGVSFGTLGAWYCVRRLNTGWSAAS